MPCTQEETKLLTIGEAATTLGLQAWQIRALYLRGLLPEPVRGGNRRLVTPGDLPAIRSALIQAGYLPAA